MDEATIQSIFDTYVKTKFDDNTMNDYKNDEVYSAVFSGDLEKLKTFTDDQLFKNNRKILHIIALAELEPEKQVEFFKYLVHDRNISLDPVDNVSSEVYPYSRALWNEFLYMRHHGCTIMTLLVQTQRNEIITEPEEALDFASINNLPNVVDHILKTTPEVDITFGENCAFYFGTNETKTKLLDHAKKYPAIYKIIEQDGQQNIVKIYEYDN